MGLKRIESLTSCKTEQCIQKFCNSVFMLRSKEGNVKMNWYSLNAFSVQLLVVLGVILKNTEESENGKINKLKSLFEKKCCWKNIEHI